MDFKQRQGLFDPQSLWNFESIFRKSSHSRKCSVSSTWLLFFSITSRYNTGSIKHNFTNNISIWRNFTMMSRSFRTEMSPFILEDPKSLIKSTSCLGIPGHTSSLEARPQSYNFHLWFIKKFNWQRLIQKIQKVRYMIQK